MISVKSPLQSSFHELSSGLPATVGLAFASAGERPISLGTWSSGVAWSTIKVPLAIAARATDNADLVVKTVTHSDNAAAEELWSQLGEPAAQRVQSVIRDAGDPTTVVESRRLRAEYTPFGQTRWSLADQARFAALALAHRQGYRMVPSGINHWALRSMLRYIGAQTREDRYRPAA